MPTIGIDIRVLGTGRVSGVENYTARLLEYMLADERADFKLFYAGRRPLERAGWMDRSNVRLFQAGLSNRLLTARTVMTGRPYLDELVGGADVFFFPHFLSGATRPFCRRVLTVHDLSFEKFPEFFSFGRRMWHRFQARPRRQVAEADKIVAVSMSTRQDIIDLYGADPAKIVTVYSGCDERNTGDASPGDGLPEKYFLMLGTIEPRKNILSAVRAFESLGRQDTALVIAGQPGWLADGLHDMLRSSAARDRIRLVGNVSDAERRRWLAGAAALIYPSFFEGFGFPPLEAMAMGTPAIVGANSSMLEICGQAAYAVDPYRVPMIRQAMVDILDDGGLRERLIRLGYKQVEHFSWADCAKNTLDVIFSTLDLRPGTLQ